MKPAHFAEFVAGVEGRLDKGQQEYGERSFSREPAELLSELEQEALDLAGWGFVLFTRLQQMRAALSESDDTPTEPRKLLKACAVAELLDIPTARVYVLAKQGKIAGVVKIGESVRFDSLLIDQWIRTGGVG